MKQYKKTIKTYFEKGDKPTQQQFSDLIDSYIDAKQPEGEANRRFVIDETGEVNLAQEQKTPEYTLSDIIDNKLSLLKDGKSIKELDLTTYIDDTNLARLVSGTIDENGIATFTRDDNTTFTVNLRGLKEDTTQFAKLNTANTYTEKQTIQLSGSTNIVDTLNLNTFGNSGLGRGTGILFNIPGEASTVKGGRISVLGDGGGAMTFSTSPNYLNTEPIERFRINSNGSFHFKSGKSTFEGDIDFKKNMLIGTDKPIAGSLITMVKEEINGSNNVGAFFDLNNSFSGTNSNFTYASVSRADYKGTGSSGNIYGAQLIGRNSGTGSSGILAGSYSVGSFKGSGNTSNVYGALAYAEIEGSGTPSIKTVLGSWSKGELANAKATIKDVFASYSDINLIGGTVTGDIALNYLDLKYDSTNQSDVSVNNLYYIKANNDTLPNVSGEAYFIKSDVELPSKLSGELEVTSYKVSALNIAPTSPSDSGNLGDIRYTSDYIYVCVANNSWKRTTLNEW
ncbi:hypothetical protein SAMN04487765_1129 [Tenacibaculum sp. MAR_2010_89]|uniref:hypothetical protein n=1 Tax=Tenacibaculum sp. MAR_2010_89 TaxID=1250198 RepID=UPI000894329F|nr:hypothetical protein [Tenacibaculum sp. MAR_2010_89]SEE02114.1 hypothetical protein SAMN04487765_1129 [Tenacibaculum sp. MAR_2010_89]